MSNSKGRDIIQKRRGKGGGGGITPGGGEKTNLSYSGTMTLSKKRTSNREMDLLQRKEEGLGGCDKD